MKETFIEDLNQLFKYERQRGQSASLESRFKTAKQKFIDNYAHFKGQIYIPQKVRDWWMSPYVTNQIEKGLTISEVYIDMSNGDYDIFKDSGVKNWDEVIEWVEEHEKDFMLLWLGEDYKILVQQELYYLWNPFERGYVTNKNYYTTNPSEDGFTYTMDEIEDMNPDLKQFAVRIDEV